MAFIIEANADRRRLSTGQRAMAVAIGLVEAGKRDGGKFVRGGVPANARSRVRHSWVDEVRTAGIVLDHAPERADAVLAGDLALDAALPTVTPEMLAQPKNSRTPDLLRAVAERRQKVWRKNRPSLSLPRP